MKHGGIAWRFAVLGGATAGLALSPAAPAGSAGIARAMLALGLAAGAGLVVARPGDRGAAPAAWLALFALAAAAGGLAVGALRLEAIDRGAFRGPVGQPTTARGFVTAVPRRSQGQVRARIQTADGRLAVESPEPVADLPIGSQVKATGTLRDPAPWEAAYLARYGIRQVLAADRLRLTRRRRGGPMALIDRIRDRAEAALGSGTPEAEAALLRGFVLGEDDRIDAATVDDFKRSGLAHLLAVSGENVILLALLAMPLLALLGIPVRARLLCVLALIAIYVPLTGAGPSIQRAGVMGAAGVIAALAGRPRTRWYAILLAAVVTLAINPRASGDAGWQLSFAAVIGILLWAKPIRDRLLGPREQSGDRERVAGWRRGLAEGAGVTIAATLSTAPLMAHDFGAVSLASLPANLLALPAVAPLMWLGMLAALVGQLPWLPVGAADRPRGPARRLRRSGRPLARLAGVGYGERLARRPSRGLWPRTSLSPWLSGSCSPARAAGRAWEGRSEPPQDPHPGDLPRGLEPRDRRPTVVWWDDRRARGWAAGGRARRGAGRRDSARPC